MMLWNGSSTGTGVPLMGVLQNAGAAELRFSGLQGEALAVGRKSRKGGCPPRSVAEVRAAIELVHH